MTRQTKHTGGYEMRGFKECKTFYLRKTKYGSIQVSKEAEFVLKESEEPEVVL